MPFTSGDHDATPPPPAPITVQASQQGDGEGSPIMDPGRIMEILAGGAPVPPEDLAADYPTQEEFNPQGWDALLGIPGGQQLGVAPEAETTSTADDGGGGEDMSVDEEVERGRIGSIIAGVRGMFSRSSSGEKADALATTSTTVPTGETPEQDSVGDGGNSTEVSRADEEPVAKKEEKSSSRWGWRPWGFRSSTTTATSESIESLELDVDTVESVNNTTSLLDRVTSRIPRLRIPFTGSQDISSQQERIFDNLIPEVDFVDRGGLRDINRGVFDADLARLLDPEGTASTNNTTAPAFYRALDNGDVALIAAVADRLLYIHNERDNDENTQAEDKRADAAEGDEGTLLQ